MDLLIIPCTLYFVDTLCPKLTNSHIFSCCGHFIFQIIFFLAKLAFSQPLVPSPTASSCFAPHLIWICKAIFELLAGCFRSAQHNQVQTQNPFLLKKSPFFDLPNPVNTVDSSDPSWQPVFKLLAKRGGGVE